MSSGDRVVIVACDTAGRMEHACLPDHETYGQWASEMEGAGYVLRELTIEELFEVLCDGAPAIH